MRLMINGKLKENIGATTVQELLDELGIISERVAVEVNLSIIRKKDFHVFRIHDGDEIEIVNFVGGGTDKRKEQSA
ncbi:MAG: sulfur carrier protein ThiS [Nitrospiraceae bacterium]|jgi:thiamine biosynthesis protein ThiS|nr:MAG: sulfur carrier protein ThiS [Nitrospiraceae bacterium]